jgi:hypothetical protein
MDDAASHDDRGARRVWHGCGGGEESRERLTRGQRVQDMEALEHRVGEGRARAADEKHGRVEWGLPGGGAHS